MKPDGKNIEKEYKQMEFLSGLLLLLLVAGLISMAMAISVVDTFVDWITLSLFLMCLGYVAVIAVVVIVGYGIYLMTGNIPGMP